MLTQIAIPIANKNGASLWVIATKYNLFTGYFFVTEPLPFIDVWTFPGSPL